MKRLEQTPPSYATLNEHKTHAETEILLPSYETLMEQEALISQPPLYTILVHVDRLFAAIRNDDASAMLKIMQESGIKSYDYFRFDDEKRQLGTYTPLMYTMIYSKKCFNELLNHDIDVNQITPTARTGLWTPLHWAVNLGDEFCAQALINHGSDVNQIVGEEHQLDPLTRAIVANQPQCVKLLIRNGANTNQEIENDGKWTALGFANRLARYSCSVAIMTASFSSKFSKNSTALKQVKDTCHIEN